MYIQEKTEIIWKWFMFSVSLSLFVLGCLHLANFFQSRIFVILAEVCLVIQIILGILLKVKNKKSWTHYGLLLNHVIFLSWYFAKYEMLFQENLIDRVMPTGVLIIILTIAVFNSAMMSHCFSVNHMRIIIFLSMLVHIVGFLYRITGFGENFVNFLFPVLGFILCTVLFSLNFFYFIGQL